MSWKRHINWMMVIEWITTIVFMAVIFIILVLINSNFDIDNGFFDSITESTSSIIVILTPLALWASVCKGVLLKGRSRWWGLPLLILLVPPITPLSLIVALALRIRQELPAVSAAGMNCQNYGILK